MGGRVTIEDLAHALGNRPGLSLKSPGAGVLRVYFEGDFTVTARLSDDGRMVLISTPVMALHSGLPAAVLNRVLSQYQPDVSSQLKARENSDFLELTDACSTDQDALAIAELMIAQKNAAIRLTAELREAIGALL